MIKSPFITKSIVLIKVKVDTGLVDEVVEDIQTILKVYKLYAGAITVGSTKVELRRVLKVRK